ncbi:serine/threonine-protein kinase [Nocardia sp. NPDC004604]|uniref:serine/threonine-protein kinase n=1 Tax=Nocardia sp. NPDC004604 TaxID=3157013 RepID=UPI0033AF47E6
MAHPGIGATIAEHVIEGVLGQGGMGTVYLARHPRLPRSVALKLLNREVSSDAELRRRFEREASVVAQLEHPNIVGIYDRGTHDGHLWIAMQYIQGSDAGRLDCRTVTGDRAARIITDVAAALDYAHAHGVLHRDIKPANILLAAPDAGRGERAVLTDFGIARLQDATTKVTATGTFVATIAYAAPEQLTGQPLDGRADQYSLACTLFSMLAGRSPFAADHPGQVVAGHLSSPVPSLVRLRPDLTAQLDAVLARAMAKEPGQRFDSCGEFAAAVADAVRYPAEPTTGLNASTVAAETVGGSPSQRATIVQDWAHPATEATAAAPYGQQIPMPPRQVQPPARKKIGFFGPAVLLVVAAVATAGVLMAVRTGPDSPGAVPAGPSTTILPSPWGPEHQVIADTFPKLVPSQKGSSASWRGALCLSSSTQPNVSIWVPDVSIWEIECQPPGSSSSQGDHVYTVMDFGTTEAAKEWIDAGMSSDHGPVRRLAHSGCVADPLVFLSHLAAGAVIAFPDDPTRSRFLVTVSPVAGSIADVPSNWFPSAPVCG